MKAAIIDYGAGNVRSVINAIERLGHEAVLTSDRDVIMSADRVIFPGQGEARQAMTMLKSKGLDQVIRELRQPVLGICIGMQLMCRHSEEGDTPCLGIFDAQVRKFQPKAGFKVPHMGWNKVELHPADPTPLSHREGQGESPQGESLYFYFVHSYYVPICKATAAVTHYSLNFSAALCKDNFLATQFHPEKSGKAGEELIRKFLSEI